MASFDVARNICQALVGGDMQFKNMAKLPEFEPEYLRNQSKDDDDGAGGGGAVEAAAEAAEEVEDTPDEEVIEE